MTDKELLAHFRRMLREHWAYEWGAAETGLVDCSGAFVWAYRQHGKAIYHGSNRIARNEVARLLPISEAKPGIMAFKARKPGESSYALPTAYREGGREYNGDLMDYHHIGLVDEDVRYVLNAKSTAEGFQRSLITEGWDAVGWAVQVDYDAKESMTMETKLAVVTAQSGSTVNMRAIPDKRGDLVERVPVGASVEVTDEADGWALVRYNGRVGYMMTEFLQMGAGDAPDEAPYADLASVVRQLADDVELLKERVHALEGGVG